MSNFRVIGLRMLILLLLTTILLLPNTLYAADVSNKTLLTSLSNNNLDSLWGLHPNNLAGTKQLASLDKQLTVYTADLDVSLLLGAVPACSKPRLLYSSNEGLVQIHIYFNEKHSRQIELHLNQLLGTPVPLVYERMAGKPIFEERCEWFVGKTTKLALVSRFGGASLELSKRGFYLPSDSNWEERLNDALLKQASAYEQCQKIPDAVSIYQELLNSTTSYDYHFTTIAQEHLAMYSQHKEVATYLGNNDGMSFSLLNNDFSEVNGQQWLRIDFDDTALHALYRQNPQEVNPLNRLAELSSVLCRVQMDSDNKKYLVVEQTWLNHSNEIIGVRPAWTQQASGWPAPFIKEACEMFLHKWFAVNNPAEPIKLPE